MTWVYPVIMAQNKRNFFVFQNLYYICSTNVLVLPQLSSTFCWSCCLWYNSWCDGRNSVEVSNLRQDTEFLEHKVVQQLVDMFWRLHHNHVTSIIYNFQVGVIYSLKKKNWNCCITNYYIFGTLFATRTQSLHMRLTLFHQLVISVPWLITWREWLSCPARDVDH